MAKDTLYVIYSALSKSGKGNTVLILSDSPAAQRERKEVTINKKKYTQIIIKGDESPSTTDHKVYFILLEGDVVDDFQPGSELKAETSNEVISKSPKGELYAAYL